MEYSSVKIELVLYLKFLYCAFHFTYFCNLMDSGMPVNSCNRKYQFMQKVNGEFPKKFYIIISNHYYFLIKRDVM